MATGAPKRYVLLYDLHYPEHDKVAWACILDCVRRNQIDGVIFGGDQLDLSCISHHKATKPLYRPKGALKSNLDGITRAGALLPNSNMTFAPVVSTPGSYTAMLSGFDAPAGTANLAVAGSNAAVTFNFTLFVTIAQRSL
jgi:hypothetical protein